MNISSLRLRIKDLIESESLKVFYKIIFVVIVFSQIFFGASTFNWTSSFSFGSPWLYFIRYYAGVLVIILCLITKKFSSKELKIYFSMIVFIMLHAAIRGFKWDPIYFLTAAMIVKDEKEQWVATTLFWIHVVNFLLVLSFAYLDIIESIIHVRSNGVIRSSLGFWHPNVTGAMILAIFIAYLFKKKDKPSMYVLVAFVPAFWVLNQRIDSRTGLIVIAFMIIGITVMKLFEKQNLSLKLFSNMNMRVFMNVLPFLFLFGSYILSYFFTIDNAVFRFLNQLFTGRIRLGNLFIHEYPITLWGVDIHQDSSYRFLDNGFLVSLLTLGLIYTLLQLFYLSWFGNKMMMRGHKYMPIILIGILLFGFMERLVWSPIWNTMFLFGGILLRKNENGSEGSEYHEHA